MKYLFLVLVLLLPTQLGKHWWPEWSLVEGVRVDYLAPTVYLTDILLFLLLISIFINHILSLRGVPTPGRDDAAIPTRLPRFGTSNVPSLAMTGAFYILFIILRTPRPWLAVYWLGRYLEILVVAKIMSLGGIFSVRSARNPRSLRRRLPVVSELRVSDGSSSMTSKMPPSTHLVLIGLAIAVLWSVGLGAGQMVLGRTTGWFWWLGERNFNLATPGVATMTVLGREILRPYATFGHPNALAGFLAVGFWLMEGPAQLSTRLFGTIRSRLVLRFGRGSGVPADFCRAKIRVRPKRTGWIINTGKAAAVIGVILTGSRGAMAGMVVGCGLWVVGRGMRKLGILGILGGLGMLGILGNLGNLGSAVKFAGEAGGERLVLAEAAGKMWRENWLMGVGPGQFLAKLPEFLPAGFYKIQPVHNVFLLALAEFGIIGLSIIIITIIKIIKSNLVNKGLAFGYKGQAFSWLPVLAVILVTGMVDHYWLTSQQNRLLLGVILGLMISISGRRSICGSGLRLRSK